MRTFHLIPQTTFESNVEPAANLSILAQDEEMTREVYARLATCPYLPIRRLDCECRNGVITLLGQVPTFYLKQVAQTLLRSVPDLQEVNNLLEVEDAPLTDDHYHSTDL